MDKTLNVNTENQELSEWSFPKMETIFHSVHPNNEIEQNETEEDNSAADLEKTAMAEIESIKKDYFRKIAILNHMLSQLEKPLATLDKELIELMQKILKTAIKKIVVKELQIDPDLSKKMIEEICLLIQAQEGVVNVFLSEEDFKKISQDFTQVNTVLKVNPSLAEGDIIVKSNMNEINAVLADRVDHLLGIKNE